MSYQSGYSLIEIQSGTEIRVWTSDVYGEAAQIPNMIALPNGDHVHCPAIDVDYSGFKLVPKINDDPPPDPGLIRPRMIAAAFNLHVENGDISNIEGGFNLVAALYLDVGQYMLLFLEPEPDENYFAQVIDGPYMRVTSRAADSFIVESRASVNGSYIDPEQFSVLVYRIPTQ